MAKDKEVRRGRGRPRLDKTYYEPEESESEESKESFASPLLQGLELDDARKDLGEIAETSTDDKEQDEGSVSSAELATEGVDKGLLEAHQNAILDLEKLRENMQCIKKSLVEEKLFEINKEIEDIEKGVHPLLAERLNEIEKRHLERAKVVDVKRQKLLAHINNCHDFRLHNAECEHAACLNEIKYKCEKDAVKRRKGIDGIHRSRKQKKGRFRRDVNLIPLLDLDAKEIEADLNLIKTTSKNSVVSLGAAE